MESTPHDAFEYFYNYGVKSLRELGHDRVDLSQRIREVLQVWTSGCFGVEDQSREIKEFLIFFETERS